MANFNNRSVNSHQFSMIPRADVPRSRFDRQTSHKTTFDAGYLIPFFVDEVLPGDSMTLKLTSFSRLATPIFPLMDNCYLDTHFFFVPNRLVWDNWQKFMGERRDPDDSIDFIVPEIVSRAGGYEPNSIYDYFGLPTAGQITGSNKVTHSALFLRAYNLIWNEWFRDENLQDSVVTNRGDGPDLYTDYTLLRRGKRHDYFTSALPWPQKGDSVPLPLGDRAPVYGLAVAGNTPFGNAIGTFKDVGGSPGLPGNYSSPTNLVVRGVGAGAGALPDIYADLSEATSATINQLRQAFQIQRLLERDARGGTRYTEILRSHFGVTSPDARLQRPEYLGGGSTPLSVNPVAQTSSTDNVSPLATLSGIGTFISRGNGFSQSFVEHGMIIGLCSVRADLNYQQGMRRMWNRSTRYDFYFPVFANLGEQAILNKEIYATGTSTDEGVFGYQERWAEYRYFPSQITGLFRSTSPGTLDGWHLAQRFTSLPSLNSDFIKDNPPLSRVLAVGSEANGAQIISDNFFSIRSVRAMPLYSVPGLIDHF